MTVKHENILKRLTKIEYILDLSTTKPKVFEKIENSIAASNAEIAVNKTELEF